MGLDAVFAEALAPLVERVEVAAANAEKAAARLSRADTSGLPTDRAAFTVKELSQLLRLDADTVRQLYHSGELVGRQSGKRILIWRWSALEFLGLNAGVEKIGAPARARRGS